MPIHPDPGLLLEAVWLWLEITLIRDHVKKKGDFLSVHHATWRRGSETETLDKKPQRFSIMPDIITESRIKKKKEPEKILH